MSELSLQELATSQDESWVATIEQVDTDEVTPEATAQRQHEIFDLSFLDELTHPNNGKLER